MSKLLNRTDSSESGGASRFFSPGTIGSVVAAAVGGYLIWQNRVKIQGFLSSMPSLMGGEKETSSSGTAKVGRSLKDTNYSSSAAI